MTLNIAQKDNSFALRHLVNCGPAGALEERARRKIRHVVGGSPFAEEKGVRP
jgi:hypothetical protein